MKLQSQVKSEKSEYLEKIKTMFDCYLDLIFLTDTYQQGTHKAQTDSMYSMYSFTALSLT